MKLSSDTYYRLQVFSRIVAAVLGGYVFTSSITLLTALLLPMPLAQSFVIAMILGIIWYTLAVIWVFSVRTTVKAWLGLVLPSVIFILLCCLLMPKGGV